MSDTMLRISEENYKAFTFSGGERHVELVDFSNIFKFKEVLIEKRIQSAEDLMDVILLNEILQRKGFESISLKMLYIPYARQDRATTNDNARSLKVFADLINSCNFRDVFVLDPHSPVASNLINNMRELNPFLPVEQFVRAVSIDYNEVVLVAPDLGALKKVESYAKQLGVKRLMAFHKERDPATGKIIRTDVVLGKEQILFNGHFIVVDDICDGGRTFIELAGQSLWGKSLNLFTTHGIYSQGLDPLFEAGFNTVGCTDSFLSKVHKEDKRLTIIGV